MGPSTKNSMKPIIEVLPEDWEAKAREFNAFRRKGDYLETPEDLLRLLLLWSDLGTYGHTAAYLKATGKYPMSKVAVYERVVKSADWLEWLTVNICRGHSFLVDSPNWLADYRVLITDASKVSRPGCKNASDVLHYMVELFTLAMAEQHLTLASTGESMTNFSSIKENDLVIADRAYGTVTSIRWIEDHKAYYAFRMKAHSFNLYSKNKQDEYEKFDLTEELTKWEEGKVLSFNLYYRSGDSYYPIRVCARGKTAEEIETGIRQIKASNNGKGRGKVSELQEIYNRFIVIVTNLPGSITASQVLELYRMRWQIELVFKRLKSIIKFDDIQTRTDASSKAWLYCKLLVAAICEIYIQRSSFSLCTNYTDEQIQTVIMDGIKSCL